MGSHLQLYASRNVILADAKLWCELKTVDIIRAPTALEEPRVKRIGQEMRLLDRSPYHLEHWASGGAIACFPFLVCEAHVCDDDLVERAVRAGREYREFQKRSNPDSTYAKHDWENDEAIKFLRRHKGCVVFGYNDGC